MAAKKNITIEARSTFTMSVACQDSAGSPVDLTGYTARAQIKEKFTDAGPLASFACTIDNPPTGVIDLVLTDEESTKTNNFAGSSIPWDLVIEDEDGAVSRILEGSATIKGGVTP